MLAYIESWIGSVYETEKGKIATEVKIQADRIFHH